MCQHPKLNYICISFLLALEDFHTTRGYFDPNTKEIIIKKCKKREGHPKKSLLLCSILCFTSASLATSGYLDFCLVFFFIIVIYFIITILLPGICETIIRKGQLVFYALPAQAWQPSGYLDFYIVFCHYWYLLHYYNLVVRHLWDNHKAGSVVMQSSNSHQAVIRQSSGSHQAVIRQSFLYTEYWVALGYNVHYTT